MCGINKITQWKTLSLMTTLSESSYINLRDSYSI